jgi:hypothetical protein
VSCSDVASLSSLLKLDVLDKDAMGRNQILGSAEFPVANLALHPKVHGAPRPLAPRSRMARACLACLQSDTWYPLVGDGVPDGAAIRVGFDFAKPRSVGCDGMHACRLAPRVSSRFVSVRSPSAGVAALWPYFCGSAPPSSTTPSSARGTHAVPSSRANAAPPAQVRMSSEKATLWLGTVARPRVLSATAGSRKAHACRQGR